MKNKHKSLFTKNAKMHTRVKKSAENGYQYLNKSKRKESIEVKNLLDSWFSDYPSKLGEEFKKDFSLSDSHIPMFFELYIHAIFRKLKYRIKVHPSIPSTKKTPDFLMKKCGFSKMFVEVTTAADVHMKNEGPVKWQYEVYDSIRNKFTNKICGLTIITSKLPSNYPNKKKILQQIEKWLSSIEPNDFQKYEESKNISDLPKVNIDDRGWEIVIRAFPLPPSLCNNGKPIILTTGAIWNLDRTVALIQNSIKNKSSRYGNFNVPYILALNINSLNLDIEDIVNALFGRIQVHIPTEISQNKKPIYSRENRGAFIHNNKYQNTRLSGIILVSNLNPWNIPHREITLIHHPGAKHPIEDGVLPFKSIKIENGEVVQEKGVSASEFFELPESWPE